MDKSTGEIQCNHMRLTCPHCGSRIRIRTSRLVTPVYRESITECKNIDCGWRGNMAIQFVSTLVPSDIPRQGIHLPLTARKQQFAAQQ